MSINSKHPQGYIQNRENIKNRQYAITIKGKSKTKQSMAADCDINNIMKTFKTTGRLPDMINSNPQYGNFANVQDFQESLETVKIAEEQFAGLNSQLRSRFDNDPAKFLDFCNQPQSSEELIKLGLIKKPDTPPKAPVPKPPKKEEKPTASK